MQVAHLRKKFPRTWKKDPTVRRIGWGGALPPNHMRRCQSPNFKGLQCGYSALKGSDYCRAHGGRNVKSKPMARDFYSKHAGPKLKALLESLAEDSDKQRMDLTGEIDIGRQLCLRAVLIYDKIVVESKLGDNNSEAKAAASEVLKRALNHITDLVHKAARVQSLRKDMLPIENAEFIANKIARMIGEEVEPINKEVAKRLVDRLDELRVLPKPGQEEIIIIRKGAKTPVERDDQEEGK